MIPGLQLATKPCVIYKRILERPDDQGSKYVVQPGDKTQTFSVERDGRLPGTFCYRYSE